MVNKTDQELSSQSKQSLLDRLRANRAERKARKQTEKAREARAEKRAIREKALEQVQEAVIASKKRKSYPGIVLLLVLIIAGLGGTLAWQYRQGEINTLTTERNNAQQVVQLLDEERQAIEAAKAAEEARLKSVVVDVNGADFTLRVPREWESQPTQFPQVTQVIGDDNVTMQIIADDSRDSSEEFIPEVDYLWKMNADGSIVSKSLQCQRFDTLGNNLEEQQREHQDFIVYCDQDAETVRIAVLAEPDNYESREGVYYLVGIKDIQQFSFIDLEAIFNEQ